VLVTIGRFSVVWDTMGKLFCSVGYNWKFFCGVGYNMENLSGVWIASGRFLCGVGYNVEIILQCGLQLEVFLWCGIQHGKFFWRVDCNRKIFMWCGIQRGNYSEVCVTTGRFSVVWYVENVENYTAKWVTTGRFFCGVGVGYNGEDYSVVGPQVKTGPLGSILIVIISSIYMYTNFPTHTHHIGSHLRWICATSNIFL